MVVVVVGEVKGLMLVVRDIVGVVVVEVLVGIVVIVVTVVLVVVVVVVDVVAVVSGSNDVFSEVVRSLRAFSEAPVTTTKGTFVESCCSCCCCC